MIQPNKFEDKINQMNKFKNLNDQFANLRTGCHNPTNLGTSDGLYSQIIIIGILTSWSCISFLETPRNENKLLVA